MSGLCLRYDPSDPSSVASKQVLAARLVPLLGKAVVDVPLSFEDKASPFLAGQVP